MDLLEIVPKVNVNIIEETLTRLGVANRREKILYPTCHLYVDVDCKYYLCHFKEMFKLRVTKPFYDNISEEDIVRRNSIALLLEDWDLIDVLNLPEENDTMFVYIIPHQDKRNWLVCPKFNMRSIL
jgi:hypothetical protein